MKIIAAVVSFIFLSAKPASDIHADWKNVRFPVEWDLTVNGDEAINRFNFENFRGRLCFTLGARKVTYYVYAKPVEKKVSNGEHAAFFSGSQCEQYSSWKEGGFPNFIFKDNIYLIDLCSTAPYLHNDASYSKLSQAIFNYVNK